MTDVVGALDSFALMVGAGLVLGEAYDEYGIWITVAGLIVLVTPITRWVRNEAARDA